MIGEGGPPVRLVEVREAAGYLCRLMEGIEDPTPQDVNRWCNIIHHWVAAGRVRAGETVPRRRFDLRDLLAVGQTWRPRRRRVAA